MAWSESKPWAFSIKKTVSAKSLGQRDLDVSEELQVARVWVGHSEHIWSILGNGRSEGIGELFM